MEMSSPIASPRTGSAIAEPASPLSTYPAARLIAPRLHSYFSNQHRGSGTFDAAIPSEMQIEAIVDTAFWTSLKREEQFTPRISLALAPPEQCEPALLFERPLPLQPNSLIRIAPGVERPGIHLGVWPIAGQLKVWGATRSLPTMCFIVETVAPGLLVIKYHQAQGAAKFANVAVLEGDQVKLLNREFSQGTACSSILASLLGFAEASNVMVRLAVSMREHAHGGSLLVVPRDNDTWRDSIARPLSYAISPPYTGLSDVLRNTPADTQQRNWREALSRGVDAVAGLTAIDGATIINQECEVLAFGAKIIRPDGAPMLEQVVMMEPIEGSTPQIVETRQLGGTRHLSAAQFAFVNRDAVSMVASQDGPFTIFAWADCDQALYGYQVEAFLL